MDRRRFLATVAGAAAGLEILRDGAVAERLLPGRSENTAHKTKQLVSIDGFNLRCEFKRGAELWKCYEDLRTRDGSIVFVSLSGESRELRKSAEASMVEGTPYLGMNLKEVALSGADLLADALLKDGDPDPERV